MFPPLIQQDPFYPPPWGIPGADVPLGMRLLPGAQVYYVQSTHASANNSNDGTDPNFPLATIAQAVTNATAARGDLIILGAGHTESWAAAVALSKSGLTVLGIGSGQLRPRINMTNIAATLTISGANVTVENVLFQVGVDSLPIMVDVNADDFTLKGCEFRENTAVAQQFLTAVDINGGGANAADRTKITGCKFVSEAAGATQAIEIGAVEDGIEIRDCFITGDYSVAGIHSGSVLTNLLLANNIIRNVNAGDFAVELSAAATGMAVGNRFYANAPGTIFDPGSLMCADNRATDGIDAGSYEIPRAGDVSLVEHCVEKADGTTPLGQDDLFVVNGPILVTGLYGLCTVAVGGASNCHLDHAVTDPAADIALSTDVAVGALISGGSITFTDVALPVLTPTAAGAVVNTAGPDYFLPAGTLKAHFSAAQAGTWRWFITYKPLSPLSWVRAAA